MRFIGFGLVTVPVLTIGAVMGDLRSDDLAPALSRHSWCADLGLDGAGGVIPMRSRSSTEDGALGAGLGLGGALGAGGVIPMRSRSSTPPEARFIGFFMSEIPV